jgi:lysophospholipase L1-like esterase
MKPIVLLLILASMLAAQDKKASEERFSTYYMQKKSLFELLPDDPGEIIFLGNSITDGCEWSELFRNPLIKNRGISGDITEGILFRLNEVTAAQPEKIFLMIGVNDLAAGKTVDSIVTNYRLIIETIRHDSPKTKLYLQSVLPVNAAYPRFKNHVDKSDSILVLNKHIKALAQEYGLTYVDLHTAFRQEDGQMNPEYSNDGLHLTGAGYILWKKLIDAYISESEGQ